MSQIPDKPVQEGGRWRHHKPSSEEVAEWFKTVPLDEGMKHEDFISGVVVIPASEKVKKQTERGTTEVWEMTYTPYVRVDTRITYFRKLAAQRDLIAVIEPVEVPHSDEAAFKNDHMPDGFWWMVAGERENAERFLCCTMRVALYEQEGYFASAEARPSREGVGTKQVTGKPDINGLAKAETGAIGRALGVAGILVLGTGIATAEDMAEARGAGAPTTLEVPEAVSEDTEEALNSRLLELQKRLQPHEQAWQEFSAWWQERAKAGGWQGAFDAPVEVRRGMATKMEGVLAGLPALAPGTRAEPPPSAPRPAPPEVLPTEGREA